MSARPGGFKLEGLLLAILGFGLSRFTVAESLQVDAAIPFLIAGLIPLIAGLGLSVFGIILAIGIFRREYVRSVTLWAYIGVAVVILIIGLTAADAVLRGDTFDMQIGSDLFVANVLLGGALGGAILGDRISSTRRSRRQAEQRAEWGIVINRLLRHDVLNAATVIHGYSALSTDQRATVDSDAIATAADRIHATIERVGDFTMDPSNDLHPIDLGSAIEEATAEFASTDVSFEIQDGVFVRADRGIVIAIRELLQALRAYQRPVEGQEAEPLRIHFDPDDYFVQVHVEADGLVLTTEELAKLNTGVLPEFDDPKTGFGFQIANMLVDQYDGDISVTQAPGTTVTISLYRTVEEGAMHSTLRVSRRELIAISTASLIAGVIMGVYLHVSAGLLPVIGALYAVPNQIVGWITHLFHSLVFGLFFVAGTTLPVFNFSYSYAVARVLLAVGWGIILWLLAAGVVMPLWLQFVGIETMVPNLSRGGLISHTLWGAVLGISYHAILRRWSRGL